VAPRAGLDDLEKRKFLPPPGLELRPLGRPARSQSLYRLRYPGSTEMGLLLISRRIFKSQQIGGVQSRDATVVCSWKYLNMKSEIQPYYHEYYYISETWLTTEY
jgi:hypothetical protein